MKLWLDDIREPPDPSWNWVKTAAEAISWLETYWGDVTAISLDHDLSAEHYSGQSTTGTGYDVASWIEAKVLFGSEPLNPSCWIRCHSMNPSGRQRIEAVIRNIESTR